MTNFVAREMDKIKLMLLSHNTSVIVLRGQLSSSKRVLIDSVSFSHKFYQKKKVLTIFTTTLYYVSTLDRLTLGWHFKDNDIRLFTLMLCRDNKSNRC